MSFATGLPLQPLDAIHGYLNLLGSHQCAAEGLGPFRGLHGRGGRLASHHRPLRVTSNSAVKEELLLIAEENARKHSRTAISHLECYGAQEDSLRRGHWAKLICGASFEDTAQVRNLSMVYTLAKVDCIDGAADRAVVAAIQSGIEAAQGIALEAGVISDVQQLKPWVMVSINDDEDIHFRKAEFDPQKCPVDCPRPCERVCPADAIVFESRSHPSSDPVSDRAHASLKDGVVAERCYGCGRCLPVCPLGLIEARNYVRDVADVAKLLQGGQVDALEIHTSEGHLPSFRKLWCELGPELQHLKLLAISLPDMENLEQAMWDMYGCMQPLQPHLLWQLDGRPMSGDIGRGTTNAAVALAKRVLSFRNRPPGFIQLAGGTNAATVPALQASGLLSPSHQQSTGEEKNDCTAPSIRTSARGVASISGVAYGGYARKIVGRVLKRLGSSGDGVIDMRLEHHPALLEEALIDVIELLNPLKGYHEGTRGQL